VRWRNILMSIAIYEYCRRFPQSARRWLMGQAKRALRGKVPVEPHFAPSYAPWDQRLCVVPDDDLFVALREGRARIVTGTIASFTQSGLEMTSGENIDADIIITATGLTMRPLGGMAITLNGRALTMSDALVYRGCMVRDLPNFAFAVGYTNASWTLKVDLAADYVCRLLRHMQRMGKNVVIPRLHDDSITPEPLIGLKSGYVFRAQSELPMQGSRLPWKLYQNYLLDNILLRYGSITDDVLELA
jgi:cation diffusion facilitator CzcD-associated flavoprotein CzcO